MKYFLGYLICAFFGHKGESFKTQVIKTKRQDTANYQEICKRCGEITEAYCITHLGPFEVNFATREEEIKHE